MKIAQKLLVIAGLFLISGLGIFPPWRFTIGSSLRINKSGSDLVLPGPWSAPWNDHGSVFNPPSESSAANFLSVELQRFTVSTMLDWPRLVAAWIAVAAFTAACYICLSIVKTAVDSVNKSNRSQ